MRLHKKAAVALNAANEAASNRVAIQKNMDELNRTIGDKAKKK